MFAEGASPLPGSHALKFALQTKPEGEAAEAFLLKVLARSLVEGVNQSQCTIASALCRNFAAKGDEQVVNLAAAVGGTHKIVPKIDRTGRKRLSRDCKVDETYAAETQQFLTVKASDKLVSLMKFCLCQLQHQMAVEQVRMQGTQAAEVGIAQRSQTPSFVSKAAVGSLKRGTV